MAIPRTTTLYYFHDPMCSWCWGFKPAWNRLKQSLPDSITVVNILGGLAPDSDVPMPDNLRKRLQDTWQRIHRQLGTEFNFEFWTQCQPRRSTYPACRAVLSAAEQGAEEAMISAIQEGYYLQAKNPSDTSTLVEFATTIGLEVERFSQRLLSEDVNQRLNAQIDFYQNMPASGFPSLVLVHNEETFSLGLDYLSADNMLQPINAIIG